jgi:transposase InsO family protein/DNA-binding CsgD family transcriptional regulator
MKFRLIAAERAQHPISLLCEVLGVSRSGFHAWLRRQPSTRWVSDVRLLEPIHQVHDESDGTYGSPGIHAALRQRGVRVGRKRVERLMRRHSLSGLVKRRKGKTTVRVPGVRPAPDLVGRDFRPAEPNRPWVADLSEAATWEGKLYLAVVLDCFSRRVVGWQTADHMRAGLVVEALELAVWQRKPTRALFIIPTRAGRANSSGRRNARSRGVAMGARRRRRSDRAGRPAMCSPGRPPVGRLERRRRFWAAIARGLSSEDAAVEAGVSAAVGVRWFREGGGMPSVTLAPASGRYLAFSEREEIALLRVRGCGVREIARPLGRSPSTISRELRRNAATRGGGLEYRASTAQWHAEMRAQRPKPAKLAVNPELRRYVQDRLDHMA